ncbi:M99 family carboxypeptidase catalytic domain-containing protein [Aliarcobacter lanthieri]|uniref:M99 family carboxypeptidase catalytic domain-containing protein n=1 Tax=Aliarcobacter lanthieri TaxID=1355374 RepID=UPI003AAD4A84
MRFLFIILFLISNIYAVSNKDFTLYKKEGTDKNHTLLIIGGIHGDEPGGYFAPAFLEKYYKIKKGSLWVAPSVNIDSMIANQRGIYKDMNRKFSTISQDDPDLKNVQKIKDLILDKQVDLVLNLHDGHGFYRQTYENAIFNPRAWGQATIIDQEKIHSLEKFGNLDEIASTVISRLNNNKLFKDYHYFGVKNTETQYKDEQQQLSLTFFAVTNNKPAFAIETSKNITDLTEKVVYQLKSIEEFMNIMDIEFERNFDLNNYEEVKKLIFDFGTVNINNNIKLDLNDIRKVLRFVPMKKNDNNLEFEHSLANVKFVNGLYHIYVGNILVTTLSPQYFDLKSSDQDIKIEVDGERIDTKFTNTIEVKNSFKILKSNFRVNVIGFSKPGIDSEDEILLKRSDIVDSFSIDNNKQAYRVEFYDGNNFCGMIIIKFKE